MKKLLYFLALLVLPVIANAQNTTTAYTSNYTVRNERVVQLSPNPSNGQFRVLFSPDHTVYNNVIAYDQNGKVVYAKKGLNVNPVQINLSHLQPGVYFLVFIGDNTEKKLTERVIIAK